MKNVIIAVLVLALCGVGFLYVAKNDGSNSVTDSATPISETDTQQTKTTTSQSAKTLDLSNKGLTKVSADSFNDNSVVVLDVSKNSLTGALPAEIRKLTNLETLNASDNNMTGIPAEIGQLSHLKVANFSNNNISGLPLEIGNLTKLEMLDLRGNPNVSKYDISLIQPKIPNAQILTD